MTGALRNRPALNRNGADAARHARIAVPACILVLPGLLAAQTQPRLLPPTNPTERVRSWYRQVLNREMDRGALRWINDLQRGVAADQVLTQVLASEEYYRLAGSSPEGFVRRLFDDLRGREPTKNRRHVGGPQSPGPRSN